MRRGNTQDAHPGFLISLLGADPNWDIETPGDQCAIVWPLKRPLVCRVAGEKVRVPREAFLITRQCAISGRGDGLFAYIRLSPPYLERLLQESELKEDISRSPFWVARPRGRRLELARRYVIHLWNEYEQRLPHHHLAIHSSLSGLLCQLLRNPASLKDLQDMPLPDMERPTSESKVYALIGRLRKDFARDWSLKDLCRDAGVNRSTLNQVFRRSTGYAPMRFIQHLRLEKAAEILESTPKTVSEVAAEVGYPDERHFYRLFKRETGFTPGRYRGQLSGDSALTKAEK